MHPTLKSGAIAIYARFSSSRQRETSIEDQVRRCREFIASAGGDPSRAIIFQDLAISGASTDRPGFEAMMAAVGEKRIDAIVTEDLSRISRDFADSAFIFKRLQFARVPLLGVADGIDTSAKHGKLSFAVKSLVADLYLDDLRDKTLRGLEGRALAGFATGSVPFGYLTKPEVDEGGRSIGSRIAIHAEEAKLVRRIFREYLEGRGFASIARSLNRDGIPSPRTGTRHKRATWAAGTIRAILYNERYAGVWRFKEREWVKVPGTNKRQPRPRDPSEVITKHRPDLRIISAEIWEQAASKLKSVHERFTERDHKPGVIRGRSTYPLSGLLVCSLCNAPMIIYGDASRYRCSTNRNRGTCTNSRSIMERVMRQRILGAICERLTDQVGMAEFRTRIATALADYGSRVSVELKERRADIAECQQQIRGLVDAIAKGERSPALMESLHGLEARLKREKAAVERLEAVADERVELPSVEEVAALAIDLDARIRQDPEAGRAMLARWLKDGAIKIGPNPQGQIVAEGTLFVVQILSDPENTKRPNDLGRYGSHVVAGAGFEPATFGL
jgi:site-specific DNA recombinase